MASKHDGYYNVVFCGDIGVGKSSLMVRFTDNTYRERNLSTLGVEFKTRTVETDGIQVKLQIWDMVGHERFRTMPASHFRIAQGFFIVFDVTNQESFDHLPGWLQRVNTHGRAPLQRLLIGNKSDMIEERVVSYERAQEFADSVGIPYLETSAKNANNVERAFSILTSSLLRDVPAKQPATGRGTVTLSAAGSGRRFLESKCCTNCF